MEGYSQEGKKMSDSEKANKSKADKVKGGE